MRHATAPMAAATATRFRSTRQPRLCRWKRILESSSTSCSGKATAQPSSAALARDFGSILDMVMDDANALNRRLGERDRAMLSQYLESVREIERRVQKMQASDLSKLKLPGLPVGTPVFDQAAATHVRHGRAGLRSEHHSRGHLHARCRKSATLLTRIWEFQTPFTRFRITRTARQRWKKLVKIQRYHTEVFASFLARLAKTPDGEGSLLDNAILLYGSNMSNSDRHDHFPLPLAVVGGGCGSCKGGQHLQYPDRTPIANLLLTLLDRAGVPADEVGDSTGRFTEI